MANTTASLEEQFETCAPAVEFADGENGQTLALLQHKDLGKIAIDCNTCMFTSWQSSSNYPKLRQEVKLPRTTIPTPGTQYRLR